MICPRCQTPDLTEIDRDGVTVDRCPRCRGVWLDRGELEKLLARARAEEEHDDDDHDHDRRDRDRDHDRHHDDDDRDRTRGRRRWSFWDIFD